MNGRRLLVSYPSGNCATLTGEFWGPGYLADDEKGTFRRVNMDTGWPEHISDDAKSVAVLLTKASSINGERMQAGNVVMLDPRCVVQDDATRQRLFYPDTTTPGAPKWVVDWLHEHPRWPPGSWRSDPPVSASPIGTGGPSLALERQMAMLRYIDSGGFRARAERLMRALPDFPFDVVCNMTYGMLENAESYWCSSQVADLVTSTSETLPSSTRLYRDMLPSDSGFMWLQRPLAGRFALPSAALAWQHDTHKDFGQIAWVQTFYVQNEAPGFWPMYPMPWKYGLTPTEAVDDVIEHGFLGRQAMIEKEGPPLRERNWFLSFLLFVQQRILIAPQQRIERHARKRLERTSYQHEPLVRVVELRRKQAKSEHNGEHESVEWSHQWVVSGHWRQQWYPSLNAHQPRWIMPYVKGPEDKPLKPPRAKVFAVVR